MKQWRAGLIVSTATLAALALAFALGEIAVRRAQPALCASLPFEAIHIARQRAFLQPCYRRETVGGRPSLVSSRVHGSSSVPHVIPLHRRAGVTRVAVLGESSGSLLGEELTRQLEGPGCGGAYEVLNCAQLASALENVERNLDEVLQYEPDVVVLVFGHNLRFRVSTDGPGLAAQQWINRSCLLTSLVRPAPHTNAADMNAADLDGRLDDFERFLHRLVGASRRRGIRLVMNTMAANLWVPPIAPRDIGARRLFEARFIEATDGPLAAARLLRPAPDDLPRAYEAFVEGEALARAGDRSRALEALRSAIDKDASGGRVHSRTNELLRRVAATSGVALRDTERELARSVGSGLPGWESFLDTCHLLPPRVHAEARAVSALMRGPSGEAGSPTCDHPPWPLEHRFELGTVLAGALRYSAGDRLRSSWHAAAALAVEQYFRQDPAATDRAITEFIAGLHGSVDPGQESRMLFAIAEGCHRGGRVDRALAVNELARRADERDPGPWYQRGLFALRAGDRGASLASLTRALAIAPADPESRDLFERVSAMPAPAAGAE